VIKAPATAFRAHNPLWSGTPESAQGALTYGGRFNPPGVSALYLSVRYETAVLEASQGFKNKMQPLTIVQYDIDCTHIIDLTDAAERRRQKIDMRDLGCAWKLLASNGAPVPSWEIAERLKTQAAAGILVKSFAPGAKRRDVNLVLWTWGSRLPHRVRAVDDERRLPGPRRS
jgi:RES domain-containing protein